MEAVVLRPNAAPVYEFLARINAQGPGEKALQPRTILDCGAGGADPVRAWILVQKSLGNLLEQGVAGPVHIMWHYK